MMTVTNKYISIITLNISGLDSLINIHILDKKQNLSVVYKKQHIISLNIGTALKYKDGQRNSNKMGSES